MYKIYLNQVENKYEVELLAKVFLRPEEFQMFEGLPQEEACETGDQEAIIIVIPDGITDKNIAKQILYERLAADLNRRPDWGIHTGVRPVKLAQEYFEKGYGEQEVRTVLHTKFLISEKKTELLLNLCALQKRVSGKPPENSAGVYIGIPFCPTRCVYCSFTSNQADQKKIDAYRKALKEEITFVGAEMKKKRILPETLYIGGGTPTTLSAEELKQLLNHICNSFDLSGIREFTVEAGRPDTITAEKLEVIRQSGAGRISINPQSMQEKTLKLIGRSHTPEAIEEAFLMAEDAKIPVVNADIIAGLPEESEEDFEDTLRRVLALGPANITVHTLAVKKASRLIEISADYNYREGQKVRRMLETAESLLAENGYIPYYLYRQKQMTGNFENVGYAKPGTEGIYNIRIMEEKQTIVALGAGGISKAYYPEENRLERVPNVSNYEIYIERLAQMLERKADNLF